MAHDGSTRRFRRVVLMLMALHCSMGPALARPCDVPLYYNDRFKRAVRDFDMKRVKRIIQDYKTRYPLQCACDGFLAIAADFNDLEVVQLLLREGFSPKAQNCDTPLHRAVFQDNVPMMTIMIKHGADINAKNEEGDTPLDYARDWNQAAAERYLLDHGAEGRSPIERWWRSIYERYSLQTIISAIFGSIYCVMAIVFREILYAHNPERNVLGKVSSILFSGLFCGAGIVGILFGIYALAVSGTPGGNWIGGLAATVMAMVVIGFMSLPGIILGAVLGYRWSGRFCRTRGPYYAVSFVLAIIPFIMVGIIFG